MNAYLKNIDNNIRLQLSYWRYHLAYRNPNEFKVNGRPYKYFIHRYNSTWRCERAIEIPIAREVLKRYEGKEVLEVGNVLAHYIGPVKHTVVDKYEHAQNVLNVDVVEYKPATCFDLILSISTLEHVGYDESQKDPQKFVKAIEHLLTLLSPNGTMLITLPLGHNPQVDQYLTNPHPCCDEVHFMKRVTKSNKWVECSWNDVKDAKYGTPFPMANGIAISIFKQGK